MVYIKSCLGLPVRFDCFRQIKLSVQQGL